MEQVKTYTFKDICSKIGSGATPTGGKEAYKGGDTALIRSQNVLDFSLSKDGLAYINEEQAQRLDNVSIQENDVLLNITRDSVARACLASHWVLPARVNQHVSIIRGKTDMVLNRYLLYYLQYRKPYLLSLSLGGATRNALTKKMIEDIEIPLPSVRYQEKVVSILSTLDKKIELNRRINDNLEQQVQALFKAWFVDFEPFKGGEFVDDDFGRRPYGWNVKPLEYLVEKVKSGDWGKDEQMGNYTMRTFCMRGADFHDIKEGSKGKMPIRYILEKNFKEKSLCDGNVVVEISGGSPTQSTGRIVLIDKTFIADCDNALICTNFCKSLEVKESFSLFFYLLWQYLYDKKVMFRYENGSNGLKNLNISSLMERELFVIPPKEIISRFNLVVSLLLSKKQANGIEISRLASLRDTLLPKLMSGNINFGY